MDSGVLLFVLRRLALGVLVVVATAVFAYGGIRLLRPELYPGEPWLEGTWRDVTGALLHLRLGEACMYAGCPAVHDLWARGIQADLALLAGGLALGIVAGYGAGTWCAAHPSSLARRALEALAMLFFCAPVYVVGYAVLLLFGPTFGLVPVGIVFQPHQYQDAFTDLGDFLRSLLVPWTIVALPIAAACLRLTIAMSVEASDEDYMRTALAKGLSRDLAVRRHAAPAARASVASYAGAVVPAVVLNLVLVEFVFSVPGFFRHTYRAFGKAPGFPPVIDYPTLQAVAVWASVCIVVIGLVADLALAALDPRVRAAGRLG
jgi:peptide/nickel transport system permease protein